MGNFSFVCNISYTDCAHKHNILCIKSSTIKDFDTILQKIKYEQKPNEIVHRWNEWYKNIMKCIVLWRYKNAIDSMSNNHMTDTHVSLKKIYFQWSEEDSMNWMDIKWTTSARTHTHTMKNGAHVIYQSHLGTNVIL